jgi:hypothetical protein
MIWGSYFLQPWRSDSHFFARPHFLSGKKIASRRDVTTQTAIMDPDWLFNHCRNHPRTCTYEVLPTSGLRQMREMIRMEHELLPPCRKEGIFEMLRIQRLFS